MYHVDAQEHCIYPQLMTVQAHITEQCVIVYFTTIQNVTQCRDSITAKSKEQDGDYHLKQLSIQPPYRDLSP